MKFYDFTSREFVLAKHDPNDAEYSFIRRPQSDVRINFNLSTYFMQCNRCLLDFISKSICIYDDYLRWSDLMGGDSPSDIILQWNWYSKADAQVNSKAICETEIMAINPRLKINELQILLLKHWRLSLFRWDCLVIQMGILRRRWVLR